MTTTTDTFTIRRQDFIALLDLLDSRAEASLDDAKVSARTDDQRLADYNEGKASAYRGAARAVRFHLGDL